MSNRSKAKSGRKGRRKQQEQKQRQKAQQKPSRAQPQREHPGTVQEPIVQESVGQAEQSGQPVQETKAPEEKEKRKRIKRVIIGSIIVLIILFLCLFLRSCRARDEPAGEQPDTSEVERIYEEDRHAEYPVPVPDAGNKRLNLALSDDYVISMDTPFFYIGFPGENIYDVVFTLKDGDGKELYRTGYVAPGTNVAIDGTGFLDRGEHKVDCLVSVYDHETGTLISDCTTVVLNIRFE